MMARSDLSAAAAEVASPARRLWPAKWAADGLTGIGAEFAEHQRRRHRAVFDRCSETEDFIPVADDLLLIYDPTDERRERPLSRWLLHRIEARKTKQMTQDEDVIGESGGVGVMLFDAEVGFVIQHAIEHNGWRPSRLRL